MILVVAEQKDGKLNRASWEAIAGAQQLAPIAGAPGVSVVVAGSNVNAVTSSKTTALHFAAAAGSVDAIAALLDRGANVNALEGVWGQTPLIFAASNNRVDAIKLLLRRGAAVE